VGRKAISRPNAAKRPKNRRGVTASGRVGIFWVHRGKLLAASVPVNQGLSTKLSVDSPIDHIDTWPQFQRKIASLADVSYEEVPRGRVLWLRRAKRFFVYLDRVLMLESVKGQILKHFGLAKEQVTFKTDGHYTTDLNALDRLFEI